MELQSVKLFPMWKPRWQWVHECMSSGGTNLCQFKVEIQEGEQSLTRMAPTWQKMSICDWDHLGWDQGSWRITELRIESKQEEIRNISSWCRVGCWECPGQSQWGSDDWGPVFGGERQCQPVDRWVGASHYGRPRMIGAEGCSFLSPRERKSGLSCQQIETEIYRSWINPSSCRLAIKEAQCNGAIQNVQYKLGRQPRQVQEVEGSTWVDECWYRVGETRDSKGDKKRDLWVWGESGTDSDQVYKGVRCSIYSGRGVLGNHMIQVAHMWRWIACQFLTWLVVPQQPPWWSPWAHPWWWRWHDQPKKIWGGQVFPTVRSRQVDGQAAVVACYKWISLGFPSPTQQWGDHCSAEH